jgi:hypothetical protein
MGRALGEDAPRRRSGANANLLRPARLFASVRRLLGGRKGGSGGNAIGRRTSGRRVQEGVGNMDYLIENPQIGLAVVVEVPQENTRRRE